MRKRITAVFCCLLAVLAFTIHEVAWTQGDRLSIFREQERRALSAYQALDKAQQGKALLRGSKGPVENVAQAYSDNIVLDYAGIPASQLSPQQKADTSESKNLLSAGTSSLHQRLRAAGRLGG